MPSPEPLPGSWHLTVFLTESFIRGGSFWADGGASLLRPHAPYRQQSTHGERLDVGAASRSIAGKRGSYRYDADLEASDNPVVAGCSAIAYN